jgi:hypothetical protein
MPDQMLQGIAYPCVVAALCAIGWFIRDIAQTVFEMKGQNAIFLERLSNMNETVDDHELRIRKVEADTRSLN